MKMAMKTETNENPSKYESVWHHVGKPAKPPSRSDAAMAMLVTSPSRRGTAIHSQASQVTRRQRSRAPVLYCRRGRGPSFPPNAFTPGAVVVVIPHIRRRSESLDRAFRGRRASPEGAGEPTGHGARARARARTHGSEPRMDHDSRVRL